MKKTAVVYWSGTGNTEAMAKAVAEGMESAGAQRCSAPTAGATASGCAAGKRTAMIPASALCARA